MKRFFTFICILLLTFPLYGFAATSPTTVNTIYSTPSISYQVVDTVQMVMEIQEMLPLDELEGYTWCEALIVELDQAYEKTQWRLLIDFTEAEEAKVVIIGESIYVQDAEIVNENTITVDFTGLEPSTYYVCFFVK